MKRIGKLKAEAMKEATKSESQQICNLVHNALALLDDHYRERKFRGKQKVFSDQLNQLLFQGPLNAHQNSKD